MILTEFNILCFKFKKSQNIRIRFLNILFLNLQNAKNSFAKRNPKKDKFLGHPFRTKYVVFYNMANIFFHCKTTQTRVNMWLKFDSLESSSQCFICPMRELYKFCHNKFGGDETRLGYERYVQGIKPNIPARTTCRHGWYKSPLNLNFNRGLCYTILP